MPRMISFFLLIGIILLIGVLFFKVMAMFLVPLFLAAVAVVLFRPWHRWLQTKCRGRERLAAGLATAAIVLATLVPAAAVFTLAGIQGSALLTYLDATTLKTRLGQLRARLGLDAPLAPDVRSLEGLFNRLLREELTAGTPDSAAQQQAVAALLRRVEKLQPQVAAETNLQPREHFDLLLETLRELNAGQPDALAFEAGQQVAVREFREFKLALFGGPYHAWLVDLANPSDEQIRQWSALVFDKVQTWALSVGGATTVFAGKLLLGVFILIIAMYFFLLDGMNMTQALMRLSPLDDAYEKELLAEFSNISRAVVTATLLAAVVQGLLAGFGYWLAGLEFTFLLMMLTMVMALVPFLGAASVWVPCCLWLLVDGRLTAAALLAFYGVAVVSMADNVIKPLLLHGRSHLHPLLALLSVLGGVQALGPIGILVGPMAVGFLQTLLNILHRELEAMERPRTGAELNAAHPVLAPADAASGPPNPGGG